MPPSCRAYIAYGSNMCREQMAERCPTARRSGVARLDGWRFRINGKGFATLVADPKSTSFGLVWHIEAQDERNLDAYEEIAAGLYGKATLTVPGHGPALIYLAADASPGRPRPAYIEPIVAAAKAAGFPASYVAELAAWHAAHGADAG